MKFLCGNCKAKYQIADEKIAGRTLRMKCRRCGHDIVIRGDEGGQRPAAPAPAAPRPQPQPAAGAGASRRRGGSSVGPAPQRARAGSALGADFRRQVTSGPQPAPRAAALDQWHVAINDVPVGPIRRDEIARKAAAGAITPESLCWREGFDDWRRIRDVPERAAVLRQRLAPPRPPAPRGRGVGGRQVGSRPRARPARPSGQGMPARGPDASRPAARSNVVPIGGRLGAAAAPAIEEPAEGIEEEQTRVSDPLFPDSLEAETGGAAAHGGQEAADTEEDQPAVGFAPPPSPSASLSSIPQAPPGASQSAADLAMQPMPSAAPARRRGLPIGAWIAIAGAGAFGMMLAAMVGTKLLQDEPQQVVVQQPAAEAEDEGSQQVEPEIVTDLPEEEPAEAEEGGGEPEEEAVAAGGGGTRTAPRTGRTGSTGGGSNRELTDEQREMLERMGEGGGSGATPGNIRVDEGNSGGGGRGGEGLTAQQRTRVVGNNRPALRRCYETAIRGSGNPPTVRMDVTVHVGASGRVMRVRAVGNDIGGLRRCIESTVRRWVFPSSGNTTETSFPVVFQPGS